MEPGRPENELQIQTSALEDAPIKVPGKPWTSIAPDGIVSELVSRRGSNGMIPSATSSWIQRPLWTICALETSRRLDVAPVFLSMPSVHSVV